MQKARRHPSWGLRQLVSEQFQGLFHSSIRSAFHLSLTVLVHYRFLVLRATQDTATNHILTRTGLSPSAA